MGLLKALFGPPVINLISLHHPDGSWCAQLRVAPVGFDSRGEAYHRRKRKDCRLSLPVCQIKPLSRTPRLLTDGSRSSAIDLWVGPGARQKPERKLEQPLITR